MDFLKMITLNLRIIMFLATALLTDTLSCMTQHNSPPITIWIHGTKLPIATHILKNFFYSKPGLHPASTIDSKYHSHAIAQCLSKSDPAKFPFETFYFFGWNGELSFEARENAAQEFNNQLNKLYTEYINHYGRAPYIRVITHSHGGSVFLVALKKLVAIKQLEATKEPKNIIVNEAILLACPVQQKTAHLIGNASLTNFYSFFSDLDLLRRADPQKLHYLWNYVTGKWDQFIKSPFFSERLFPFQSNLTQIQVSHGQVFHISRGLMHIEFLLEPFLKNLGSLLDQLKKQKEQPNPPQLCNFVIKSN